MKKFLLLILIALAAWQASRHLPGLFARRPEHEAVVLNRSGRGIERLRLTVDRRTFVDESIDPGGETRFRFTVRHDAAFDLVWAFGGADHETRWRGGLVPKGSMVQRHDIVIDREGGVVYHVVPIPAPGRRSPGG